MEDTTKAAQAEEIAQPEETAQTEAPAPAEEAEQPEPPAENKKPKKERKKSESALTAELDAARAKLTEQEDAYKRMLAEYANYKRRTEQEKEQLGQFTRGEVLKALLPALDNLQRAVEAPPGDEYKAGVDMTIHQLEKTLADMGLSEIEAQDAPFDPELHHAVMREDADGVEPDTVTQVFQKGYRYGDRVLRPAMVKVAN